MVYNDAHIHISLGDCKGPVYPQSIAEIAANPYFDRIGKCIVMLNPLLRKYYTCPRDPEHWVMLTRENDVLGFRCVTCGAQVSREVLLFHRLNVELVESCDAFPSVYPFLYFPMDDEYISSELAWFENNYSGRFFGIKLHPNASNVKLSSLRFSSEHPLIIHSGVESVSDPHDILGFAKRYSGRVSIAHACRLNVEALSSIGSISNIYTDLSPSYYLRTVLDGSATKLFDRDLWNDASDINGLVEKMLSYIPEDRLLFGSDLPFGSINETADNAARLPLSLVTQFNSNFNRFLGI